MGFDGTTMSQRLRVMLDSLRPAGIILFKRNLEHAERTHALLNAAQKAAETPMFLCVECARDMLQRDEIIIPKIHLDGDEEAV